VNLFPIGSAAREAAVKAYIFAWQRGMYSLLGISGLEVLMCLLLRRVELSTGKKDEVVEKDPRDHPGQGEEPGMGAKADQ